MLERPIADRLALPAIFFGIRDLCAPLRDMMPTDAAGSARSE